MQFYRARVRINGSLLHEVIKTDLSAAEIAILQTIHSSENPAVVDIKRSKTTHREIDKADEEENAGGEKTPLAQWTMKQEREYLLRKYPRHFKKVFLNDFAPLPELVPDLDEPTMIEPEEIVPVLQKLKRKEPAMAALG